MSFQEAIESKLITDYRLWLPDATTTEAWQGRCCIDLTLCRFSLFLSIFTKGLVMRIVFLCLQGLPVELADFKGGDEIAAKALPFHIDEEHDDHVETGCAN